VVVATHDGHLKIGQDSVKDADGATPPDHHSDRMERWRGKDVATPSDRATRQSLLLADRGVDGIAPRLEPDKSTRRG
jgi:hypothetical protein